MTKECRMSLEMKITFAEIKNRAKYMFFVTLHDPNIFF